MSGHYLKHNPDKNGWFGEYGGAFLPPELEKPFAEIAAAYARISVSADFQNELQYIRKHFQG
ncbi:MAG: tryptophan synthase subunit beta, partial [bacterium]|nr:tryptophan synthase subunit beta [bacterium]